MDAISYSYADKAHKRIKKFINDPDSSSGIITVPKVIATGESVTVPAGRVAVLPNVQVDGTMTVNGEVFIPSGSTYSNTNITSTNGSFDVLKTQGQNVSPFTGFKNYIINGGFDIWQRGTVFSSPANETLVADRWKIGWAGGTVTQVYKGGEVFSNGYNTLAIDGKAGNTTLEVRQYIESLNCRKFKAGTKVTVSFDVFTNTGFTAKTLIVSNHRPISIDMFSTLYDGITSTISLSSGSQISKQSVTFTIPTNHFSWGTVLTCQLPTGLGAGETIAFGNIQLEEGSIATPFEQRPIGLELSLCQRYYRAYLSYNTTQAERAFHTRYATNGSILFVSPNIPFEDMRVKPTVSLSCLNGSATRVPGVSHNGIIETDWFVYQNGFNSFAVYKNVNAVANAIVAFDATLSAEF